MGKVVIFAAPSGSGKSTIIGELLPQFPQLQFSISATSRQPRGSEKDGIEYYFLSSQQFESRVAQGQFIEWEEVYNGSYYGTLRSEIERIWGEGNVVVFDIDVRGALNVKEIFGDDALALFIMPPSVKELRLRLEKRATDSAEAIASRIGKAEEEISYSPKFDKVVVNDNLQQAVEQCKQLIQNHIK